jgi:hypothetical protein
MHLKGYPLPVAVFTVNFGASTPSRTKQFCKYKNIALTITEVTKFEYTYVIHCNELFYETKNGVVLSADADDEVEADSVYEFSITHSMSRGPHKLFNSARIGCSGQWVLLVRSSTLLFLLMDARGNVLGQQERLLTNIPGIDWIDPL